jgi:hypothetical protein
LFAIFLIVCLAAPAVAGNLFSPPGEGWTEKSGTDEYKTYARNVTGSDTKEVVMVGIMNVAPKACFDAVGRYEEFPQFMPYIKFSKRVHSEKVNEDKTINHVFFLISPPLVSARFYTLRLEDEANADGKPGVYRSTWDLEKGEYRKTPMDPDVKDAVKNPEGAIETPFNKGYWLFEPVENGKKTRVTYYVWTNPGGAIPTWMANMGNTIALPKLWSALKSKARAISK